MIKCKDAYTPFDSALTNYILTKKIVGAGNPEESMQNTADLIPKLNNLCDESTQEILNGKIKLNSKKNVRTYNQNLQRLFEDLTTLIMSTNESEETQDNANRWQETVKKFLVLYFNFLNEIKKKSDLFTESELIEYTSILEDDFIQDIQRANYQLLILIYQDKTIPEELKKMIEDYL